MFLGISIYTQSTLSRCTVPGVKRVTLSSLLRLCLEHKDLHITSSLKTYTERDGIRLFLKQVFFFPSYTTTNMFLSCVGFESFLVIFVSMVFFFLLCQVTTEKEILSICIFIQQAVDNQAKSKLNFLLIERWG